MDALGQVASLDAEGGPPVERAAEALNAALPGDVAVVAAAEAEPNFHARFSAQARTYRYRIYRRPARSPLERRRSLWVPRPLDEEAFAGLPACQLIGANLIESGMQRLGQVRHGRTPPAPGEQ